MPGTRNRLPTLVLGAVGVEAFPGAAAQEPAQPTCQIQLGVLKASKSLSALWCFLGEPLQQHPGRLG